METTSQIEPWRNPILRERAFRPYYQSSEEMPFHPWEHAVKVRDVARAKAIVAMAYHDMVLNLDVIELGTLAHDIDVHKQPGKDYNCCTTKERHSAHLAGAIVLPKLCTPLDITQHAVHVIKTTERDVRCEGDNEAKCGCQGDMWSVMSENPDDIIIGSISHFREKRLLAGNPAPRLLNLEELTESAANDHLYLRGFIEPEELGLGPWDVDSDGLSPSQRGQLNNLQLHPNKFPSVMRDRFPYMLAAA